jgi:hypothetical protein
MLGHCRSLLSVYALEGKMTYKELKPLIAGVTVKSLQEKEVGIESLWEGRRIVLAFLRHFG